MIPWTWRQGGQTAWVGRQGPSLVGLDGEKLKDWGDEEEGAGDVICHPAGQGKAGKA